MQSDSPFKRLRTLVGLTGAQFAAEAGLSRQAVTNLEAGMYEDVPMRAHVSLSEMVRDHGIDAVHVLNEEYGSGSLNEAMHRWQREKRQQVDMKAWDQATMKQIIARFDSPGTFCRKLCIPSSAIYHLMYGKSDVVPDVIRRALTDAGYPYAERL